jgi:hypothetical protein
MRTRFARLIATQCGAPKLTSRAPLPGRPKRRSTIGTTIMFSAAVELSAARAAVRAGVLPPEELYMDKNFVHSLRFGCIFSHESCGKRRATPIPCGSRPSIAALMRPGVTKASEILMLIFRVALAFGDAFATRSGVGNEFVEPAAPLRTIQGAQGSQNGSGGRSLGSRQAPVLGVPF